MDKPKETRAPDYRDIYSNQIKTRISPWDIALTFGMGTMDVEGKNILEEKVTVTLSPHQFKILAIVAANALNAFEKNFGTIHVPQALMPNSQMAETVAQTLSAFKPTSEN